MFVGHRVDEVTEGCAIRIGDKDPHSIMNYYEDGESCQITDLDGQNTTALYNCPNGKTIKDAHRRYRDMLVEHVVPPLCAVD